MLLIFGGCCNCYFGYIRQKIHRLPNFNMLFQHALIKVSEIELGPVVRTPASANPGLNFSPAFFFFFFFTKSTLSDNVLYYMAESVSAMRLVNLRFVTCYTDQNFKENAHFGALNLFISEEKVEIKLQDVYQP